ncbi:hypothetical protein G3I60_05010 [Streptomyces sp. SID13666]|uniref:hypothetical protein n=1 Tax=Streptomyces sp. SID13666 TaxID=2706054 RepID=UPI0013BEF9EC|nr:hypothetical protein [Streptomyces sp. SID13666]NEA53529.1 hypothetical protein [Streptomyces sp. SID13666]
MITVAIPTADLPVAPDAALAPTDFPAELGAYLDTLTIDALYDVRAKCADRLGLAHKAALVAGVRAAVVDLAEQSELDSSQPVDRAEFTAKSYSNGNFWVCDSVVFVHSDGVRTDTGLDEMPCHSHLTNLSDLIGAGEDDVLTVDLTTGVVTHL